MEKKLLNENTIKQIVSEAIKGYLMELSIADSMGKNGPLTKNELITPSEILGNSYKLLKRYQKEVKSGKRANINIDKVFSDDPGYIIWKNYVKNMIGSFDMEDGNEVDDEGDVIKNPVLRGVKNHKGKDYPKIARDFEGWLKTLNGTKFQYYAYKSGENYLFGFWTNGVFVASYISTDGQRGLLRLIGDLTRYNNVVFAVTLDMADMLERVGMFTDGEIRMVPFAGHMSEKKVFASTENALYSFYMGVLAQRGNNKRGRGTRRR